MNFGVYQALTKSRPFRMIRNMDNEINEWLEHEYSAFERQFFSHCRVWRLPVHVLKGTDLYRLGRSKGIFLRVSAETNLDDHCHRHFPGCSPRNAPSWLKWIRF